MKKEWDNDSSSSSRSVRLRAPRKSKTASTMMISSGIEPRDIDILCGKSKECVTHPGNSRYRQFIGCTAKPHLVAVRTTRGPETVRRVEEEAGCRIEQLQLISQYYVSPGGTSEHCSLYCGFVDRAGKRFGQEMCSNANRTIKTVEYMWPRPGENAPSHKMSYYTMAGSLICGVGFYQ